MTEHRNNSTQKQRISSFEPGTMFLGTILAVLSAIVCMQILGKVGVSANTSILGAIFAMLVSRIPVEEAWAPGIATAEVLEAGDEGGSKAKRIVQGIVAGAVGTHFGIPVAAIGITFITSIVSMVALGIGLVIRGYSEQLTGFAIGETYIPQGFMIGAGAIALIQSILSIIKGSKKNHENTVKQKNITVTDEQAKKTIFMSFGIHVIGAIFIGVLTGVLMDMSLIMMILWVFWTAFASVASMMLVGMAAMYSGWFPAFAITTIFLTIGMLMGFPPLAVAVLTGYISSVGPCFADMGYDLKTGWIIRGRGEDADYEVYGRKQQVNIEIYGAVIGIIIVMIFANMTLNQGLIPASSTTFAATCQAVANPEMVKSLLWAIPGAIVQFIGGKHMFGVLFATGLVINSPIYGIGVLVTVAIRLIFRKKGDDFMNCRDAGLIAGDGLYGFFSSLLKMFS